MKKTLWALVAAVFLLAALLLIKDYRYKSAAGPRHAFDPARIRDVVRLQVAYQQDSATVIKAGGRWLVLPDSFPADTSRVATALDRLLKVQDRERVSVSTDTARLMEYGLHSGEVKRVSWALADGGTFGILLGKTSGADYSSTYWKRDDKPEVYRTPGSFTYEIPPRPVDWKASHLFPPFSESDVKSLAVDWVDAAGKPVRYKLGWVNDTAIRLTEPREAQVPAGNAANLWEQASRLVIDDFPAPGDTNLARAALDVPAVTVRIELKSGAVHELKAGGLFDDYHYARHPMMREGRVKISKWRLDAFKKTVGELLDTTAVEEQGFDGDHGYDDGHGH